MARTFGFHTLGWTVCLVILHTGLRWITGTASPASFLADLMVFLAPMLALSALAGGVAASRHLIPTSPELLRRLSTLLVTAVVIGAGAYGIADQVAPRVWAGDIARQGAVSTRWTEPRALTSAQLRRDAREAAALATEQNTGGAGSVELWQTVNQLAFFHEQRIVQALLIPIMGLVGVLSGLWASRLGSPWRTAALWGLGLFLALAMFMSGENGYELIVLRSSGPMAFVAWLQLVVPGSVLVGLTFATLPELLRPLPSSA